jgi:hypothetical protein
MEPHEFPIHCRCGMRYDLEGRSEQLAAEPRTPPQLLAEAELAKLRQIDPTLIGNRLESLFKAVGVPPCGGCEKRRDWLNRAHAWVRDTLSA